MPTYTCVLGDSDTYKIHTRQLKSLPIRLRVRGVTASSIFFLQYPVPCGKEKQSTSQVNSTFNLRVQDKPQHLHTYAHAPHTYAQAHWGVSPKSCLVGNSCCRGAALFCHDLAVHHFSGDFTIFSPVSSGLVSLTYYVMIFQSLEDELVPV